MQLEKKLEKAEKKLDNMSKKMDRLTIKRTKEELESCFEWSFDCCFLVQNSMPETRSVLPPIGPVKDGGFWGFSQPNKSSVNLYIRLFCTIAPTAGKII